MGKLRAKHYSADLCQLILPEGINRYLNMPIYKIGQLSVRDCHNLWFCQQKNHLSKIFAPKPRLIDSKKIY
jgi:hypothetical protein